MTDNYRSRAGVSVPAAWRAAATLLLGTMVFSCGDGLLQPELDSVSPLPQASTADALAPTTTVALTLEPVAVGTHDAWSLGAGTNKVAAVALPHDDDASYVTATGNGPRQTYYFPDVSAAQIPDGSTINSVTVHTRDGRFSGPAGPSHVIIMAVPSGSDYEAPAHTPPTSSYANHGHAFTTDPVTGLPWSLATLRSWGSSTATTPRSFGLRHSQGGRTGRLTTIYLVIEYTPDSTDTDPPAAAPTGFEVTALSHERVRLSWSEVGGARRYEYRMDGGAFVDVGEVTTVEVGGLASATSYSFEVRARNDAGAGPIAGPVAVTTQAAPPPGTTLQLQPVAIGPHDEWALGAGTAKVAAVLLPHDDNSSYLTATGNGPRQTFFFPGVTVQQIPDGATINGVTVHSRDGRFAGSAGGAGHTIIMAVPGGGDFGAPAHTVPYGTYGDHSHTFTVDPSTNEPWTVATLRSWESAAATAPRSFGLRHSQGGRTGRLTTLSLVIDFTLGEQEPEPPAAAPDDFTATALSPSQVRLSWSAVSGATGYEYRIDGGSFIDAGDVTQVDVTDLAPATQYGFEVRAYNGAGPGPIAGPVSASTPAEPSVSSVVVSPESHKFTGLDETVQFTAAAFDGEGAPIEADFAWSSSDEGVATVNEAGLATAVANGTAWIIASVDGVADSASVEVAVPPAAAPDDFTATALSPSQVRLSWSAVSGATGYEYRIDGGSFIDAGDVMQVDVTDLAPATQYGFEVRAYNGAGPGPIAGPVSASTPAEPSVSSVVVSPESHTFTGLDETVQFTAAAFDGEGAPIEADFAWSSSDEGVATVNEAGLATAVANGTAWIIASVDGVADSASVEVAVPPAAAPDDFTATALSPSQVRLSWSAVSGATGYEYRIDGGSFIDAGDVTQVDVTDLAPATQYGFEVRAYNGAGPGPIAGPVSASTPAEPSVSSVVVSPESHTFTGLDETVQFTVAAFDGEGAPIEAEFSWSSSDEGVATVNEAGLAVAVANGTAWILASVDGVADSASVEVAVPPAAAPDDFTATALSPSQVRLSWSAVSGATGYEYRIDGGSFTDVGDVTQVDVTDLAPATQYGFEVRAYNGAGPGPIAGPVSASTPAEPSVSSVVVSPESHTFTGLGETVQFTVAAFDGEGAPIEAEFSWSSSDEGVATVNEAGLALAVANGTAWIIASVDGVADSASVEVAAPPAAAPANFTAAALSPSQVRLSWSAVSGATGYEYRIDGGSFTDVGDVTITDVLGLQAATSYSFEVRGRNEAGLGPAAGPVSATTPPSTPDQEITFVSSSGVSNTGTTGATLTVPAPAGIQAGDVIIAQSYYRTAPVTPPPGFTNIDPVNVHRQSPWIKVSNGNEPLEYTWTQGESSGRFAVIMVVYRGVDPVSPVAGHGFAQDGLGTTFTAPSVETQVANALVVRMWSGGGSGDITPPSGVVLRRRHSSTLSARPNQAIADALQPIAGPSGISVATSALQTGPYNHTVVLRPAGSGGGDPHEPPAAAPADFAAIVQSAYRVDLSWSAVPDATSYEYRVDGGEWVAVGGQLEAQVTGLVPSTDYALEVRATNSAGAGPSAGPITATTHAEPGPPTTPPGGFAAIALSHDRISLSWSSVAEAASYEYRRDGGAWTDVGDVTQTEAAGLQPETSYSFEVRARNTAGPGPAAGPVLATTPALPTTQAITFVSSSGASNTGTIGTSLTVPAPSGIQPGDVIIAQSLYRTGPVTPPPGFTIIDPVNVHRQSPWIKVSDGNEPFEYTWTQGESSGRFAVIMAVYRGVDTADPVITHGFYSDPIGMALTAPSVNTQVAEALVIRMWSATGSGEIVPPAGVALRLRHSSTVNQRPNLALADAIQHAAGPSGAAVATVQVESGSYNHTVVLRPAGIGGGEPPLPPAAAPPNFSAAVVSASQINLSWGVVDGASGYQYRVNGGTWLNAGNVLFVQVAGLIASTEYSFEVRGANAGGPGPLAGPINATTHSGGPSDPTVLWAWSGGQTASGAAVRTRLSAAAFDVRLRLSTDPAFGSYTETAMSPTGTNNVASFTASGLAPNTHYYYRVVVGNNEFGGSQGAFRTLPAPGSFSSFTFALGSCQRTDSNATAFDHIRGLGPLFWLQLGDIHYSDFNSNQIALFRGAYDKLHAQPRQAALYLSTPLVYVWDDHDGGGGNNGDATGPGWPAARAAYRENVPHHTLVDGNAIYHSFVVGRVRFIVSDLRSERSPNSQFDDAGKSMFGAAQKQHFMQELAAAKASGQFIAWVSSVPWIAPATSGSDDWSGFATERQGIADYIQSIGVSDQMLMLTGDMHATAIDSGANNAWGGFPVFNPGPIDQNSSTKGGPYTHGPFTNGSAGLQFGLVTVTDNGGPTITVEFSGRRSGGSGEAEIAGANHSFTLTLN